MVQPPLVVVARGAQAASCSELPETLMGAEGTPPGHGEGREAHDSPA